MKMIALCIVGVIAFGVGLWPQSAQQVDPLAAVKKRNRDKRWHNPLMVGRAVPKGIPMAVSVDFVDTYNYDTAPANQKAAIKSRMSGDNLKHRKEKNCPAELIVFGRIELLKGVVTEDKTNVYSVYKLTINDIFRNSRNLNLRPGSEIEFTASGGIGPEGEIAEDMSYSRLLSDQNYILYLKYDEEADDYYVLAGPGIYRILPNGEAIRGDFKHAFIARMASIADEPRTFDRVAEEAKNLVCK